MLGHLLKETFKPAQACVFNNTQWLRSTRFEMTTTQQTVEASVRDLQCVRQQGQHIPGEVLAF